MTTTILILLWLAYLEARLHHGLAAEEAKR
jgi:hypothetical protein